MTTRLTALILGATLLTPLAVQAQQIDFGSDTSAWANDGECDDPRFEGEGMADVTVAGDQGGDASDCRAAYDAGTITLIGAGGAQAGGGVKGGGEAGGQQGGQVAGDIDYGDDTSQWANDGECDDPRFSGAGVANTAIGPDAYHDASDCRAAVMAGTAVLTGAGGTGGGKGGQVAAGTGPDIVSDGIIWGDDLGDYPNDGECDDRRFGGGAMATSLGGNNIGHDASDCQALFQQGAIYMWNQAESAAALSCANIDFGDDSGQYPADGQCDDPRFEGISLAWGVNSTEVGRDATDCSRACDLGTVSARDY